jgi:hypothetical protein
MKIITLLVAVTFITSCSSSKIKIDVIYGKELKRCSAIGKVIGTNEEGIEDLAINIAKDKVKDLDGDTLLVRDNVQNGRMITIEGVAYKCKEVN